MSQHDNPLVAALRNMMAPQKPGPYTSPPNVVDWWGESLFENSNDFSVLAKFNREAGLLELQESLNADNAVPVQLSMWAADCSDAYAVGVVRKHLDAGVLQTLATKQIQNFFNPMKKEDCTFNGYTGVLLAACAMSLGCTTFDSLTGYHVQFRLYKDYIKAVYEFAYMTVEAATQFEKALQTFEPGKPYAFGSKTREQDRQEKLAKGWTDIQATPCALYVIGGLPKEHLKDPSKRLRAKSKMIGSVGPYTKEDADHADNECGKCGNKTAKLKCGRCKDVLYCNSECQKQDWQDHKACCRTPENRKYMEGNPLFMNTYSMEHVSSMMPFNMK